MSNLSEEEIINNLWDLLHLNTYLDLNNEMKEKCEIPREVLKRWFENSKGLLDLYNKAEEKLAEYKKQLDLDYVEENYVRKDKIREFFSERLLKYTEADDGKYDKPYLTRGELELVDRYGECKEIAKILLAEEIELPKECISKDEIRKALDDGILDAKGRGEEGGTDIVAQKILRLLEEE